MKKTVTILLLGSVPFLFAPLLASAQDARIVGTVIDEESGEPLPGANVQLVELQQGAATSSEGSYELAGIPPGAYTLRVSFIGYLPVEEEVTLEAGQVLTRDLALRPDIAQLQEIAVTALGIERDVRSLGYAVQSVEGAALANAATSNVVNALAGKSAGVHITSSSGQPGKAARMVIRGNTSLLGDNQPLFVVDGIPISNAEDENQAGPGFSIVLVGGTTNRGLDLDPNIIEDVTVLKGAAATALYGSRAANGAVVITTRRGQEGQLRPRIAFSSRLRIDENVVTGFQDQYLQGQNGFFQNGLPEDRGGYVEPGAVDIDDEPISTTTTTLSWGPHKDEVSQQVLADLGVDRIPTYNPRADFFDTGLTAENSLNISGGTENTSYFFSASNLRQDGTVPTTKLDRTSLLANFGISFSNNLRTQSSVNFVKTENDFLAEGNGPRAYWFSLIHAPLSFDLSNFEYEDGTQRVFSASESINNPFWLARNQRYGSSLDRLIGHTDISYDILPWLTLSERIGIDTYNDTRKEELNVGTRSRRAGSMYDQKITRTQVNSDLTLQLDRQLNEDFGIDATLGNNLNSRFFQFSLVQGDNLGVPGFFNVANASVVTGQEQRERQVLVSAYGQASLDYRNFLFLTLTGRNDWSSTLPADNNSYFYPSASLGFVFTDAFRSTFEGLPLSFGKLRASVAQIGSDAPTYALSTIFFQANPGDGQRGNINYPFNGQNGFLLSNSLGNPDLRPEISTEYEAGIDLRLFDERARLDVAYYNRTTNDQIFPVEISPTTGFRQRLVNAGELRNFGWEISVGGTPIRTENLAWDLEANWSTNTTEVVELAEGVESIFLVGFTSPQVRATAGKDGYGVIWGPTLLRNGMLDEPFEGVDENVLIIGDDGLPIHTGQNGVIGHVQPDWLANVRTGITFRNLSLSALIDVRQGGDVLNFDHFYSVSAGTAKITENRGTPTTWDGVNVNTGEPNTDEVIQDEAYYRDFYGSILSTELFVEDGSYIKLRELSLSYTLPGSWTQAIGLQSARITGIGRNLWIASDFTYRDPEGSLGGSGNGQGFYHGVTPGTRSYSVGIDLTF